MMASSSTVSLLSQMLEDFSPVTFVVGIVITGLVTKWLLSRRAWPLPWPVVPGAAPFVGNFHQIGNLDNLNNKLTEWADIYAKQTGIFRFSMVGIHYVVACREDTVMEVTAQRPFKIQRSKQIRSSASGIGADGVFSAEGDIWKNDRRIVAPLLNKKNVKDYLSSIITIASRLVQKWKATSEEGSSVVLYGDFYSFMIDIIALAGCGKDFDSLRQPSSGIAKDIEFVLNRAILRALSPVPYWKIPFIGQFLDGVAPSMNRILRFLEDIISEYEVSKNETQKDTFMGKLVALTDGSSSRLSRQRMVGNIVTLFFGGTDSSAAHLTTMIWILAEDPKLQQQLAKEAKDLGSVQESTTADLMSKMPMARAFMYEVYRFYGPFPLMLFRAAEEVTLSGTKLAADTNIMVLQRYVSTNELCPAKGVPRGDPENEFPPSEFHPHRYLVKESNGSLSVQVPDSRSGAFMAFGAGPRVCPGRELSELVNLVTLASLLQAFEFAIEPNHPEIGRVLKFSEMPDKDIRVVLTPRSDTV